MRLISQCVRVCDFFFFIKLGSCLKQKGIYRRRLNRKIHAKIHLTNERNLCSVCLVIFHWCVQFSCGCDCGWGCVFFEFEWVFRILQRVKRICKWFFFQCGFKVLATTKKLTNCFIIFFVSFHSAARSCRYWLVYKNILNNTHDKHCEECAYHHIYTYTNTHIHGTQSADFDRECGHPRHQQITENFAITKKSHTDIVSVCICESIWETEKKTKTKTKTRINWPENVETNLQNKK